MVIYMEQLQNLLLPEESRIDQGYYFQSLLAAVAENNLMKEAELTKLQYNLVELLTKQTERFTNGESSSVTVERAQSLLQGICYHISVYLKSLPVMEQKVKKLKEGKTEEMFREGMAAVTVIYQEAEEKLRKLQTISPRYDNQAYQDTLFHGLVEFFHDYELEFAPQEGGGSIDYPLCREIPGCSGVEYILIYLKQLEEENRFLEYFSEQQITALLQGFHRDYRELLINIYELVLTNALGLVLAGKNPTELSMAPEDREWLQRNLMGRSRVELRARLAAAYEELKNSLDYTEVLPDYGRKCAEQLAERLYHNLQLNTLEQIFITSYKRIQSKPSVSNTEAAYADESAKGHPDMGTLFYEEGSRMEDEKLRELIEILNTMKVTSDKLDTVKRGVHSLEDLTELLPICFDKDEYFEVFESLNDTELEVLLQRVEESGNPYRREESRQDWQDSILDYYSNHRKA